MDDLLRSSAVAQAAAIRRGELSAGELLEAYLARIEALDATVNAFVQHLHERARRRVGRLPEGPLTGVPFGMKDTEAMRGARLQVGSRAYRYVVSPVDAPIVKRARELGLNIVGKTSTSELALMPVVETDLHEPTRNPWNPDYTAGGSSGGSAAAVAAGLLPVANASDGAGSIRIPASLNHLYGLKPSRSLTAHYYRGFDPVGLAVVNSVAHHVEDSAVVLDGLVGRSAVTPAEDSFLAATRRPPPSGLRIGVCVTSPLVDVDPEVASATHRVAEVLEAMGNHVEPMDGAHDGTLEDFIPIYGRLLANPPVPLERKLQPVTRWMRQVGRGISTKDAAARTATLARIVDRWFGDHDLVITPTVAADPPKVHAWRDLAPEPQFRAAASLGAFTAPFNLTGQPAASIPAGLSAAGLPIGVQVVARRDEDALLLSVSAELQRALQWTTIRSPVFERSVEGPEA